MVRNAGSWPVARPASEGKAWCAEALAAGRIVEVDVELADGTRRRSVMAHALLYRAASLPEPSSCVRLLSPFDPVLRDRARAERLFGFRYRIEIFVPKAQRGYGYCVFPVMQGHRVISRLDARRVGRTIRVRAFWPEAGERMGRARQDGLAAELARVNRLAGMEAVEFAEGWMRSQRSPW